MSTSRRSPAGLAGTNCLVLAENQHRRLATQRACDKSFPDLGNLRHGGCGGQLTRHLEESARARFALRSEVSLLTKPGRQLADHETDDQHDDEGEHILYVRHGERILRRHEKPVERQHIDNCDKNRRASAQLHRNWNHCEQIQHHDVGELERPMQRYRDKRCDRRRGECCRIAGPDVRSRDARDSASRLTLLFVDPGERAPGLGRASRRSSVIDEVYPTEIRKRDESLF